MNVLVIGGGGREHTLVWKIAQSPLVEKIYCVPGNAGISQLAECGDIVDPSDEQAFPALADFAKDEKIDLTLVGPEAPLAAGLVDYLGEQGLKVFGPSGRAALVESSKVFSKELMRCYDIPTARAQYFFNPELAKSYITRKTGVPIVVKADGLCAGKGSIVCKTIKEAYEAVKLIMLDKVFGKAGENILVEECLEGEEVSFIAFTDGNTVLPMPSSQDHKPIYDGDKGPNTGGMGAYSPAPVVTPELSLEIMETIMKPAVKAMADQRRPYRGVLYAGLIITEDGPKVLEFNCRFGDPETQAVLPRLKSDIVPVMLACIDGTLDQVQLEWTDEACVCVVMASGGYPGSYEKGNIIQGLEYAGAMENVMVFHAGTTKRGNNIVTNGGRVLGVTALGSTIGGAIDLAYQAVAKISFGGAYFRKDIGHKALG